MAEGDERAAKIYDTIGVYFGYAVAYYAQFYDIEYVLVLGRVTSGEGGVRLLKRARCSAEFPELAGRSTGDPRRVQPPRGAVDRRREPAGDSEVSAMKSKSPTLCH